MLKPACSNCLLYNVRCSTTAIRRRAAPNVATTLAAANIINTAETSQASSAIDGDSLEARLARIEAKLDKLGDTSNATPPEQLLGSTSGQDKGTAVLSPGLTLSQADLDVLRRRDEHSIPPLTEVLPVVEDYFRDFNFALPLFRQQDFMRMLYEFYSEREKTKESGAVWAAINVVLAIGYRTRNVECNDITVIFDDRKVKKCIDNAQRELDGLVTREDDTLGVQVLLGLVGKSASDMAYEYPRSFPLCLLAYLDTTTTLYYTEPSLKRLCYSTFPDEHGPKTSICLNQYRCSTSPSIVTSHKILSI